MNNIPASMLSAPEKTILSFPNIEASKFIKLIADCTLDNVSLNLNTSPQNFVAGLKPANYVNVGIVLADPATRLWKAFCAFKSDPSFQQSFGEFYRDKNRIELYYRTFKNMPIEKIGFVGIYEAFYHSILLSEQWHLSQLTRIQYGHLLQSEFAYNNGDTLNKLLGEETLSEIRELYANDYMIYSEAKRVFNKRWERYSKRAAMNVHEGKQIYVHVGPPKTGTSALQSWLNRSTQSLEKLGIFYPPHKIDKNGVSSGNFENFVTFAEDGKGFFDDDKATAIINKFNESNFRTLLISSEHFFYYLLWFFSRLPSSKYIFYIRHPISSLESGFHQEVKRHGRTADFSVPQKITFTNLSIISNLARAFGVDIVYRYYGDKSFEGGSLYSDFSCCFEEFIPPPKLEKRLNTQYSAGALQLMRFANTFAEKWLLRELDFFLQKESENRENFSLLSSSDVAELKHALKESAMKVLSAEKNLDENKFNALLASFDHLPFYNESETVKDLKFVLDRLKNKRLDLALALNKQISHKAHDIDDSRLYKIIRSHTAPSAYEYYKNKLNEILPKLLRRLKNK
ncbi:hypothetical protein JC525_18470 [Alteromonas sp. IB21]|uniref:hypothetical protein n=1 Tax=Alteromonas sp. IB21 TaxID=2779369 RepID=UPI0018E6F4F1|nr:hypothetical protein [Alteromonas sp. IB21]MBJ2130916.1 hypothetical protein [Alteromonas sp. IB21]